MHSYKRGQSKKHIKKSITLVIGLLIMMLVFVLLGFLYLKKPAVAPRSSNVNQQSSKEEAPDSIKSISAKYLFSGTVVPARAVENEARLPNGSVDYDQPFSKLDSFNPGQYDEWTVDMECPITDANIPYRQQVENTIFNCRPEFLPAMSKYFTIFNLANNHVYDQGKAKFPSMQKYVEQADLQYLGNQDPAATKDVCEVMAMKVKLNKEDGKAQEGKLPIALCAWHYFERNPLPGEFDVMKKYAEIMPVIGLMQVGVEYAPKAGADQESVGRSIIDGGAEFVIGNSPHWVQNSEVYKNKLIFYSTGNFVFDQLDTETNRGASVEASMTLDYDENVAKWLELADSCKAHYDDCLEQAKKQNLTKIKPKFNFDLVASTTGYKKVTQKADESTQKAVEDRANWLKTLKELGQR